ncbi:hypothetical protein [Desulfosoma sp.]|uniref:hypothetical protein n=1 Tax=Desulfosoma sp. TaxID=2603217 RepID=UPI0040490F16
MNRLLLACFLLVLTVVTSCGDRGPQPQKSTTGTSPRLIFTEEASAEAHWPDARLRQVFTEYWNAMLEGRWEDAYRQEADYVRQLVSKERYFKVMEFMTDPKKVSAFEVGVPRARSPYLYEIPLQLKIPSPAEGLPTPARLDYWVKTDTGWYHAVKASLLFPELGFGAAMPGPLGPIPQGKEVEKES